MKYIKKAILLLLSIMLFSFLNFYFCNAILSRKSEENIGKYIINYTPVGSSKEDVKKFINMKGYNLIYDSNKPEFLRGVAFPRNYLPEKYSIGIGSSHITVCIAESMLSLFVNVNVMCTWIFDDDDKLLVIDIKKYYDSL